MAYAVLVERLEAQVRSAQQAAWLARAMGADAEVVMLDQAIADFDDLLASEPAVIDDADRELREALGLRGAGG